MPTEPKNEDQEFLNLEEQQKPAVKKDKQVFRRAIKRDYQRQDFYQKTR